MLSFQQQQNGANGEQTTPAMRLRDDPPPITPATTRNSRKRKSPPNLNPDPNPQPIQHVLPPHPLIHPIPPFPYPPADYSPGGLPPPHPPQSAPSVALQQSSPTQAAAAAAGRTLSQSKRAEQNRKAQRAFRERRDQHVKALESRSQLLDAALASADEANRRWEECRALVDQLRVENAALRAALSQAQLLSPSNTLAPLPPPPPPPPLAVATAPNTVSEPPTVDSRSREEQTLCTAPREDVKHDEPGTDKQSSAKD